MNIKSQYWLQEHGMKGSVQHKRLKFDFKSRLSRLRIKWFLYRGWKVEHVEETVDHYKGSWYAHMAYIYLTKMGEGNDG